MLPEKEYKKKVRDLEQKIVSKYGKGTYVINKKDLSVTLPCGEFSYDEMMKELSTKNKGGRQKLQH